MSLTLSTSYTEGKSGKKSLVQSPFLLDSNGVFPRDLQSAYDMALYLSSLNPRFINALVTKFSFFITDLTVDSKSLSADEAESFIDNLESVYGIFNLMHELGRSTAIYGNGFVVPYYKFTRHLRFANGQVVSLDHLISSGVSVSFEVDKGNVPQYSIAFDGKTYKADVFFDTPYTGNDGLRFRVVAPQQMHLMHHIISGRTDYVYAFESSLRTGIKDSSERRLFLANDLPREMLMALLRDRDFKYRQDYIYHFKLPTAPGIADNGLGIPPAIEFFRPLFNLQVYRKMDEALGLDYMMPFRIFSPASGTNLQDVLQHHNLASWRSAIKTVIDARRKDKYAMHSLPFPVTYQEFGASGKSLTPKDLIQYTQDDLLNSIGYPVELFNNSLSWQAMPMALRLFESTNLHLHKALQDFCSWVSRLVCRHLRKDYVPVTLRRPTIADNIERRQILMQLMQMQEISRKTGLESLGITDPVDEGIRRADEDTQLERARMRKQEELQREMEAGIYTEDGSGDTSGPGVTPQDLEQQAVALAEQWLAVPSDGQRSQMMQQVRMQDEQLYALAKQRMEEIRNAGASQGRQQTNAMYQEGGPQ
jgi:hypothetical protein